MKNLGFLSLIFLLTLITGFVSGQTAEFSADKTDVCLNEILRFTDASTGATSWEWDFGDGAIPATAVGVGPHDVLYTTTGNKTVRLTINGSHSENKPNYISVSPSSVGGVITGSTSPVCVGSSTGNMELTGYTGGVEKWQKRYNGGTWTDIVNATIYHSENLLSPGIYQFRVFVKSGPCASAISDEVTIEVNPEPVGSVTVKPEVCSTTGFNFNPQDNITNGVLSTFTWTASYPAGLTGGTSSGSGNINETLTNLTGGVLNAVYTVTPTSITGSCEGSDFTITVPVKPEPVGTNSTEPQICSGVSFNINPQNNITNSISGTFSWTASYPAELTGGTGSGTGNINETLTNLTGGVLNAEYTVTPSSLTGSCPGTTFIITVPVKPRPVVSNSTETAVCSGDAFVFDPQDNISNSLTCSFSWIAAYPAGLSGGTGSGTGDISETLNNYSGSQISAVYTVTPVSSTGSCGGPAFTITVPVRSQPVGSNTVKPEVCSATGFNYDPQDNITNGITSTFTWTAAYASGLTGGAASGINNINETLTNLTGGVLNAVYTVIPTSVTGTCAGAGFTITVPVKPAPVGTSSTEPQICSGVSFNKNPQNNITNGILCTFSWIASYPAELTGGTGSGTGNINQTLTNLTGGVLNAEYTVTPSSLTGSCPGTTFIITVPVKPRPVVSNSTETAVCSGDAFVFDPQDNISNSLTCSFSWIAAYPAGLSGGTGSGTGDISETLNNYSGSQISAVYTVTPVSSTGSCGGPAFTITVPVGPQPVGANSIEPAKCSDTPFNLDPQDNITNSVTGTFTWAATYAPGLTGGLTNGSGNIDETLTNLSGNILNAVYTVTPSSVTGSCEGSDFTITVPVKPEPVATSSTEPEVCSDLPFNINPQNNITNGILCTFSWIASYPAELTGGAGSGTGNINQTLTNLTVDVLNAVYTVTPTSSPGSCPGSTFTITVPVWPEPLGTNSTETVICSGNNFSFNPQDNITNGISGSFSWTASYPAGLTGGSPNGAGSINQTINNLTGGLLNAVYTVTPVAVTGSCKGSIYTITVPVQSQPVGTNTTETVICSGTSFDKNPQDNITNSVSCSFIWTASFPAGLTGGVLNGIDNINQTLFNFSGNSLDAVYTVTPISQTGSCSGAPFNITMPVNPEPAGMAKPADQAVCSGLPLQEIELINNNNVSGTTFSWIRDNIINVTGMPGSGSGNISGNLTNNTGTAQTVTFNITPQSGAGCPGASFIATLTVNPLPVVDFAIKNTFNIAEDPFTLTGTPPGGIFSGPGVVSSENKFYPSVAGLGGPYLITYTYTDVNGCSSSIGYPVSVQKADRVITGFNSSGVHCYEEGDINIEVMTAGDPGKFSGDGIYDNGDNTAVFNTVKAGSGNHIISYQYVELGSVYTIEEVVYVDSVGIIDFVGLMPEYCVDHGFVNLTGISPAGGTGNFYGPENGFISAGKTAQLQTSLAGAGTYTIRYEYISDFGCPAETSKPVTIHSLPSLNLLIRPTFNITESSVNLIPFALPAGGEFSGRGVTSSESLFSPSLAGLGATTISYVYKDANGCVSNASQEVSVLQANGTIEGFPVNNVVCYDADIVNIKGTSTNGLPGGFFSGNGISSAGPDSATFNPVTAGAGNHTIYYNYIDINNTEFQISKTILVDSTGIVDFVGLAEGYCETAGEITLNALCPAGGTGLFTGPPEGIFSLGKSAFFRPYNLDPDVYNIEFIYTSNYGCTSKESKEVIIYPLPEVTLNLRETFNVNESPISLVGTGIPEGGQFSGTGVSSSDNLFSPGLAGLGTFQITYQYSDIHSCANADTQYVSIVESQALIQGFRESGIVCYSETPFEITGSSANGLPGGYFTGDGITNTTSDKALFNPVTATAGSHLITYHYLDFAGTKFEINKNVYVDSIGKVDFINLSDGTEFCKNDGSLELIAAPLGGIFSATSGLADNIFYPVNANLGENNVRYTYTSQYGCLKESNKTVIINEIPSINFGIQDPCVNIFDPDSTQFLNSTNTQNDRIVKWQWNFGNNLATETENNSDLYEPKHLYRTSGLRNVRLSAETEKGCYETLVKQIDIGDKPRANFTWDNECYATDYSIKFTDASQSNTPVSTYTWVFYDTDGITTLDTLDSHNAEFIFPALSYYDVSLSLTTNLGCYDTIRKTIYLRPTVHLSDGDYYEDFEDGTYGWVPENTGGTSVNSWAYGPTTGTAFGAPINGINAWFTDITNKTDMEQSWISSPCFDFRGSVKPMIRLDVWKYFEKNRDGGIIQFSIDNGSTWQNLGTIGDGINWYNSFQIAGQPGGQQVGWTAPANGLPDTTWTDVRHDLDQLAGEPKVRLRIAYGSNGTGLNNEGFAFNNILISERSRLVLLEHFTNTSDIKSPAADNTVNNVAAAKPYDIAIVNYHTSFPGNDPINQHNQADPAARSLFYGVSSTPYSIMDGGLEGKGRYDFYLSDFNELDLSLRSFIDPEFEMEITQLWVEDNITAKVEITSLKNIDKKEITLHVVIVEKEIEASLVGLSGSVVYKNVVKVLLPDAGGTKLPENWNSGQTESYNLSWYPENVFNTGKLAVVAFVQDEKTKEVYQAGASSEYGIPTGGNTEIQIPVQPKVTIFPNPAGDHVYFHFNETLTTAHKLEIYSLTGTLLHSEIFREGNSLFLYNTEHIKKGVYFYRILKNNSPVVSGKIVIIN